MVRGCNYSSTGGLGSNIVAMHLESGTERGLISLALSSLIWGLCDLGAVCSIFLSLKSSFVHWR